MFLISSDGGIQGCFFSSIFRPKRIYLAFYENKGQAKTGRATPAFCTSSITARRAGSFDHSARFRASGFDIYHHYQWKAPVLFVQDIIGWNKRSTPFFSTGKVRCRRIGHLFYRINLLSEATFLTDQDQSAAVHHYLWNLHPGVSCSAIFYLPILFLS